MDRIRVVIGGTRYFSDYELLCSFVDKCLMNQKGKDITIISGGCRGTDKLGERYAKERGYKLEVFTAEWDKLGKKAGVIRNEEMVISADYVIAFWDGESRGTYNLLTLAKRYGKPFRLKVYKDKTI